MRVAYFFFCATLVVSLSASADGQNKTSTKSAEAEKAIDDYLQELFKLDVRFRAAQKGSESKYVTDASVLRDNTVAQLKVLLTKATKDAELDKAIKIRDEVKRLESAKIEAPSLRRTVSPKVSELEKQITSLRSQLAAKAGKAKKPPGRGYVVISEAKTWAEASRHCELLGGHLVRIESREEHQLIITLVQADRFIGYWVDGSDQAKEGDWRFSNGKQLGFSFFHPGEPNGGEANNHILIWKDAKWEGCDGNGADKLPYICEWE